ncbi:leucine-rich repeat domain-containing protein [Flavobacterium sp. UBA4197]|uniref:leucine-rich repeat domain-containing protein n=1 Tax=Flavobacterium sp. UBA4197 TaxID=1946546 RepID=UPI00257B5476|nr:leucine-rich repeat domain-containing protein [Flavobacterium sp. UBA4197]
MKKPAVIKKLEEILGENLFERNFYEDNFNASFYETDRNTFSVDFDNQVVSLNLVSNNIKDLDFIKDFKNLIALNLSNNSITDISLLKELSELLYLSLDSNLLKSIDDSTNNLVKIKYLSLENNNIDDIAELRLSDIEYLNVRSNQLRSILGIKGLTKLKRIEAGHNYIDDVSVISKFTQLEFLDFSYNKIDDISALKNLRNIKTIHFSSNSIFDLSPIYPLIKHNIENKKINKEPLFFYFFDDNPIHYPYIQFNGLTDEACFIWFENIRYRAEGIIKHCIENRTNILDLGSIGITDLDLIPELYSCTHIEELILSNEWAEFKDSEWVKKYSGNNDNAHNNIFEIPKEISKLKNLKKLIVGGSWNYTLRREPWRIKNIDNLKTLKKLEILNVSNNQIEDISCLTKLSNLTELYVNNNKIVKFPSYQSLEKLIALNVSNNRISALDFIKNLKSIRLIDLHSNNLNDISILSELVSKEVKIIINNNPIVEQQNWKLEKYKNHSISLMNYFSKMESEELGDYILPVKVLLLGNHLTGKSTLLDYLLSPKKKKEIIDRNDSTHIIRIEKFPKLSKSNVLPEIIYFDFGGQDYYHGIYKAFLTNGAINLLLWNNKTNRNSIRREDSGKYTRDFSKKYWLYQLKYYYNQMNLRNSHIKEDIILLVQTYADSGDFKRESLKEDIDIMNEFNIALNQMAIKNNELYKINLDYLERTLRAIIEKERKKIKQPIWYKDFLSYILNYKKKEAISIHDLLNEYKRGRLDSEKQDDILNYLRDDLDQLNSQGLILYYKHISELKDIVWLNPVLLTKYIHEKILKKEILKNGIIEKNELKKIIGNDEKLLELLTIQQVIFYDSSHERYFVPSFLKLSDASNSKNEYDILTFGLGNPTYVLKFENFIPFGIVNQLICHFGDNPDSKFFWRDQLIFTFRGITKCLIKLDFSNLIIEVYFQFLTKEIRTQELIKKYIFNCIIAIYNDIPLLEFNEFDLENKNEVDRTISRKLDTDSFMNIIDMLPDDLYLSIDNEWFVRGGDIFKNENDKLIGSYKKEKKKNINEENTEECIIDLNFEIRKNIPIYNFKNFTNKQLNKMKKIFISYSKQDLVLVNEFQNHLSALKLDNKISSWYCTELMAGGEWDNDIQKNFDESDIICFMISPNLMRTDYIHKYEIAKAFERYNKDKSLKIVPIILDYCNWNTNVNDLGEFTALPYMAKPISDFDNRNMAWYIVIECLKLIIEKEEQPEGEDWFNDVRKLPNNVLKIYERIVNGLVDKNSK